MAKGHNFCAAALYRQSTFSCPSSRLHALTQLYLPVSRSSLALSLSSPHTQPQNLQ